MNIGQKIASLRKENNFTQAELGAKLNLTAQAVSKWKNGLSEPDLESVKKLCEIFGVSVSSFLETEEVKNESSIKTNSTKETVSFYTEDKNSESLPIIKKEEPKPNKTVDYEKIESIKNFKKGFIWASVVFGIVALIFVIVCIKKYNPGMLVGTILAPIGAFTLTSTLIWESYIVDVFEWFIRSISAPFGFIFELSLDGIIWLITVKLLMWIFCGILSILLFIVGLFVSFFLSIISFPFICVAKIKEVRA
jgi:transcriptional regulator with XRE-family HTH domain